MTAARNVLALVAVTLVAYAASGGTAFQYDDFRVIVDDSRVHSWSAWAASMPGMRALTKATYVLNWSDPAVPRTFAWTGVAIHVACALAVLALARRWIPAMAPACPRPEAAALVCALVFALHPAQTEAVVYAAARSTSLSSLATLLGLYAWERARDGSRGAWIAATIVALAASLASREAAWILPFAVVLVEMARGSRVRDAFIRSAPLWIALIAFAALGFTIAAHRQLLASSLSVRSPLENLVAQVDAVTYLVTHPLATLRVNFDPDLVAREATDASWWAKLACIGAYFAIAFAQLRRRPWLAFSMLWLALALLPTHGVLARLELANDRQLHLAMAGPGLAVGVALASMSARRIATGVAIGLVAILGVATFVRVGDYASESRLWRATVEASPMNARAWNNLGYALAAEGDRAGARTAYERALALDPASPRARGNLDALERASGMTR
ncbi:MAG: tetratricopeptide repeat protein [Burkholderiales bacterium]